MNIKLRNAVKAATFVAGIAGMLGTTVAHADALVELDTSMWDNSAEYTSDVFSRGKVGDNNLDTINASSAWARGFTGQGAKIMIIDSGINIGHSEFAGSITETKCFIRRCSGRRGGGIADKVGHGTLMASIAAGNWDGTGNGTSGVAYNADLAIAKITNRNSASDVGMRKAIKWGASIDATVANISSNTRYRGRYGNWKMMDDGSFYNADKRFKRNYYTGRRATGFYRGLNPKKWAKALGDSEMVIVVSSGNSGLAYPENPATIATATKDDGTLWLGGQMLIAGAWDVENNRSAGYSNKAGHLCQYKNQVGGTCLDTYRISDYYIMAPGQAFGAGKRGDSYVLGTGTSEAAATVSGAVAIVHSQWPHMKGSNIVKLLTQTANRDIPGYNKEEHGMGLLDLERATRPIGEIGIPTEGRKGTVPLSGSISVTGGSAELASSLSSVMTVDEYGRDFYVDMSAGVQAKKTPKVAFNPHTRANFYSGYNPYDNINTYQFDNKLGFGADNEYDMRVAMNEEIGSGTLMELGHTLALNDSASVRVGMGFMNEEGQYMDQSLGGAFGEIDDSTTSFVNVSGKYDLSSITKGFSAFGSAWVGETEADMQTQGIVTNVSDTQSYSWNVGLDYTLNDKYDNSHSFGSTFSQPVTISRSEVDIAVASGFNADGSTYYERSTVDMAPDANQYNIGTYYKFGNESHSLTAYAEHEMNYLNQADVTNNVVGASYAWTF